MSWPVVELGAVVSFIGGSQPPKATFKYEPEAGYVRLLQIRDYKSDKNLTYIPETSTKKFCTKDDVMIGRYGPPVFQILRGLEGAYNVALMKAQPGEKVDNDYLYYFLKQDKLFRLIDGLSQRTAGQSGIDMGALKAYPMLLPPLDEQKRIATILDKADGIRQKRKQAIELADEFLRCVFLDMFGDPVTNPKGWETKSLKEVSEHVNDCPHSTPKWTDAGVICLRTSNLTKGGWNWDDTRYVSDETYSERTKRGKLEQGDIILSREGTVGIAALVPESIEMCMGQRLVQVRANRKFVLPEYLLYLLLFELEPKRITRLMAGSTSKHINVRDLKQLKILLPPIDLQKKFVEVMSKAKATSSSMVLFSDDSVNSSLALSQKAFSGEL